MPNNNQYQQLQNFLHTAGKQTWAAAGESRTEKDGSTTFTYQQDDWTYNDNFFGSNPFAGREVVFFQKKPVFFTSYYGWVEAGQDADKIYTFLKLALLQDKSSPHHRGPSEFQADDLTYKHQVTDLDNQIHSFTGSEQIYVKGELAYQAWYFGGVIAD